MAPGHFSNSSVSLSGVNNLALLCQQIKNILQIIKMNRENKLVSAFSL